MKSPLAAILLTFALVPAAALAQQALPPPPAEAGQEPITDAELLEQSPITLDVTRVNLLFTVTDKKGRFVSDLLKEDFEVRENDEVQNILEFTAETDLPLRLAILVDTSNSIRDRFRFLQEAAIDFMYAAIRPRQDAAAVMGFDSSTQLAVTLTDDIGALTSAVDRMRPGGGTALYDAIYRSAEVLSEEQPRDKFRRAIVVLSDGEDTLSYYSREQALEAAQKADVVIYTISTNVTRGRSDGDKTLERFAEETGGAAFFPFKVEDMEQSFVNIANELRHQYNLLYRPEPLVADGQYHEIEVRVKVNQDLNVRARKGYYAPSPVQ